MRLLLFTIAFSLIPFYLIGNGKIDSLLHVFSSNNDFSIKANAAYDISNYYKKRNPDSSLLFIDSAFFYCIDSALISNIFRTKADVYGNLFDSEKFIIYLDSALMFTKKDSVRVLIYTTKGNHYRDKGYYVQAESYYDSIFVIRNLNSSQIIDVYQCKASLEKERSNYIKAINLQFKAHEILLSSSDSNFHKKIARSYNQIAILYKLQKDYDKALEFYYKAVNINSKINKPKHKKWLSYNFNNIGNVFLEKEIFDSAIYYHQKSLEIKQEIKDYKTICSSYSNIGEAYILNKEYAKALEQLLLAKSCSDSTENKQILSYVNLNLGKLYFNLNDLPLARNYLEKSMIISKELSFIENIMYGADYLSKIYLSQKKYEKALEMRNLNIKMKDSILDIENTRAIIRNQYQLMAKSDSTANALELELQQQKLKAKNTELEENERKLTYLSIAILLFLGLIVFIYSRLRVIRNQKEIIDGAFVQLEEKSNEIQDSIEYAKRIQRGISPSMDLIRNFFPESFVFYQPKSVVAGDFFWVKKINNNLLFAVGDCTGHGVPGAMVSVLCQSILNRVVADFKFFNPSKILDEARKLIVEHLDYGNEVIHDGMDIALCSFDTSTSKMQFAGANNPLWVVRNNELLEFKGDHQPVGYFQKSKNFTNNTLQVKKGDMVFVFSDGFSDQFGGEKGKKYKLGNFKKFILSINEKKFPSYSTELEREFNQWKGDNEQVDDVCILGIKF